MGGAAWHKLDAGWLVAQSGTGLGGGRQLLTARLNSLRPLCAYRQAIAAYPHEPGAYYQIGNLSAEGKIDAQTGISALQAYLGMPIDWREGNQAFCWAHYRLAQIWARLGDTNKADAEYQQALACVFR